MKDGFRSGMTLLKHGRVKLLALASISALAACSSAIGSPMHSPAMAGRMDLASVQAMVASWPEASRMAAMDMMHKYGPPHEVTASMLMWKNNGPWSWTKVSRETIPHNFPMPHPDLLEQAIDYQVPVDRFDDLARYDGSVIAERTKGQLSARCDKEGANFLAINLAHDVATGRRTVDDARAYYARAMKTFMSTKRMDPYMQGLRFNPPRGDVGDPDRPAM